MLRRLLVVALVIQSSLLATTSLGDGFDYHGTITSEYDQFTQSDDDALVADLDEWGSPWDPQPDWQSFTVQESSANLTSIRENPSSANANCTTFAFTESEESESNTTFTESGELTSDTSFTGSSLTDNDAFIQRSDEDDEVYFDTSSARMVYRARESDATSLAALETPLCATGNPIDDCWRCDPDWREHRKSLATCVTGFGRGTLGGRNGEYYLVTNPADSPENPRRGTLRHAVTRAGPLWITFASDMTIRLKGELWVTSFKTLDGRGADVHVVGAQITIQNATNVIVHGIAVHDVKVTGPTRVRVGARRVVERVASDGDALHVLNSRRVWVDHCYFASAADGLVDFTRGSSLITVSNNVFENHNKVMLLGSSPDFPRDRKMRATVCYNRFGVGLVQRMPRCRFGTFHIVNNHYSHGWDKYAIGGSEDPMILSQGNVFDAGRKREVTKHIDDGGPTFGGWETWHWASTGDLFLNGAFFTGSGAPPTKASVYAKAISTTPRPASLVLAMTKSAGPILSFKTSK